MVTRQLEEANAEVVAMNPQDSRSNYPWGTGRSIKQMGAKLLLTMGIALLEPQGACCWEGLTWHDGNSRKRRY
jgi:hypothetical protein